MIECPIIFIILLSTSTLYALDNGLALTPPMGWMHWERYLCITDCNTYPDQCISEKLFRSVADHMVSDGYKDAGYEYVMIDDCWSSETRDKNNRLEPDKQRFPSGMKNLSDYIHSKGLKFGIYGDYGTKTCQGFPGSFSHLKIDADTFAEWGVDYLKLDGCYNDNKPMEDGWTEMGKYLNATGRPIAYSCSWPAYQGLGSNYSRAAEDCNLWRYYGDIDDSFDSVKQIVKWVGKNQDKFASIAGPGHWNDPDMLVIGNFGLSYDEAKLQMALWAIMAAPLIMSVDLKNIQPQFKDILLNKDLIAIDQDPLGIQGRLILEHNSYNIWTKQMIPVNCNASFAIAIVSDLSSGYPFKVEFKLSELNLTHPTGYKVKSVFEPASLKGNDEWSIYDNHAVFVNPSGVVLLTATPLDKKDVEI